jgi:uncharacterized OB-fold protein
LCGACLGDAFEWAEIPPTGTVYSYTVVRRAFLPGSDHRVPFTVLQVQFDAAPGVTLLTNLADEGDAPAVRVGTRVVIAFTEVATVRGSATMPYARVIDA